MSLMNPSIREMREELSKGEEFVERYNRPGPRYTSYPTAPVWTDSFGPKEYEAAIETAMQKGSPVSCTCIFPSAKACVCSAPATSSFKR